MHSLNYRKKVLKDRLETEKTPRTTKYPETTDYIIRKRSSQDTQEDMITLPRNSTSRAEIQTSEIT
jgi:hypothetical protein